MSDLLFAKKETADRACPCDGCSDLQLLYEGPIRAGAVGALTAESFRVLRCPHVDVAYLEPFPTVDYESEAYRRAYNASGEIETYFRLHDDLQLPNLEMLEGVSLRGKTVADFGCGGGAFLDRVRGYARRTIGVEPYQLFRTSLAERGHLAFQYGAELLQAGFEGGVDVAVSFHVIEHVQSPRGFLEEMCRSLVPGGVACVATPNLGDFLLDMGGEPYKRFWFRTAHLWYFSLHGLTTLAEAVGFRVRRRGFVQSYDLGNALLWLRDGKPQGNGRVGWIDESVNAAWKAQLEAKGLADSFFVILEKP